MTDREVQERLDNDTEFYARHAVKIVTGAGKLVPVIPTPGQLKLEAAMKRQEAAGKPIRIMDLKSRKTGHSTWMQIKMLQRATRRSNWKGVTIAHDKKTVGELFDISFTAYTQMPSDPRLGLRPPLANNRRQNFLKFGNPPSMVAKNGDLGLNSSLTVDTANEFEAGRGFTVQGMHGSEVAFWADIARKWLALMNMLTDDPETMAVWETTANGFNEYKDFWDDTVAGKNDYEAVFVGWLEDPNCRRRFASGQDLEDFLDAMDSGPEGEAEPALRALMTGEFGMDEQEIHERLYWRRWAIHNRAGGDLDKFRQEYPATPEEAFVGSGRTVFPATYVVPAITKAEILPPPAQGILTAGSSVVKTTRRGEEIIPTSALWVPKEATGFTGRDPVWKVWAPLEGEEDGPKRPPKDAYIAALDPADDSEVDEDALRSGRQDDAAHAIVIINQETREQVATLQARTDPDWIMEQLLLAGLFFHGAILAVEVTGGYGSPIARWLTLVARYRRMYYRRNLENKKDRKLENLGWDTNVRTKPHIEAHFLQMLREGTHGIRDPELARQMLTYIIDARGRHVPQKGTYSDKLMAMMIAQFVAQDEPLRKPGEDVGPVSMVNRRRNPVTGY